VSSRLEKLEAEIVRLKGIRETLDSHYTRVRWIWWSLVLVAPGLFWGGLLGGLAMVFLTFVLVGVSTYIVQVRRFEVRSDIRIIEGYIAREVEGPRESRPVVLGEGWNRYKKGS